MSHDMFNLLTCFTDFYAFLLFRPHRSTTFVDTVYCCRLSTVICLSVVVVNPAKMVEPIEMQFKIWTWVGPRKHVLGTLVQFGEYR